MSDLQPSRGSTDLAEMVELLLDKGVVVNADIVVSVGDTELLGIRLRAAVASFETAAQYGLEFPAGTDPERVEAVTGATPRVVGERPDDAADGRDDGETDDGNESDDTDERRETDAETASDTNGDAGA